MTTQLVRSTDSLYHVHTTFYHVTITSMRLHEITRIDTSRMTKAQKKAHESQIALLCNKLGIYVYIYRCICIYYIIDMFVYNTRLGYIWTEVVRAAGRRGLRARLRSSATTVWN